MGKQEVCQERQYKDRNGGDNDLKPVLRLRIRKYNEGTDGRESFNGSSDYLALVGEWRPTKRGSGQATTLGALVNSANVMHPCRRQTYSNYGDHTVSVVEEPVATFDLEKQPSKGNSLVPEGIFINRCGSWVAPRSAPGISD